MSGRHGNLKRRKGKCNPEAKGSSKSPLKRKVTKRQKVDITHTTATMSQKSTTYCVGSEPTEISQISCECHRKTCCAALPEREEVYSKENKVGMIEPDHCSSSAFPEKMESEDMEGIENKTVFPDDDSNQILPVEQFFGNLEVVQDCPQRSTATSTFSKRELRRRNYYAKEDSNDGDCSTDMQQEAAPQTECVG